MKAAHISADHQKLRHIFRIRELIARLLSSNYRSMLDTS
jgi:hypothetical protein